MTANDSLTPKQIAQELDRHIVGQSDAKRAVAIALRNRWRRMQLDPELRDEGQPQEHSQDPAPLAWVKPKLPDAWQNLLMRP